MNLSITFPAALDQMVRWAQDRARASNPGPEILALLPRLQLADGESLVGVGSGAEDAEVRIAVSSHGSQTQVDLTLTFAVPGDGLVHAAEDVAMSAAAQLEMGREWPAARDEVVAQFRRWQAAGVAELPPVVPKSKVTAPPGVDWSPDGLRRNRDGRVTPAQAIELKAAVLRRDVDTGGDGSAARTPRAVRGGPDRSSLPVCAGQARAEPGGRRGHRGRGARTESHGLFFVGSEVQVFYWPRTHRVLNWANPPRDREPTTYAIVRRSRAGPRTRPRNRRDAVVRRVSAVSCPAGGPCAPRSVCRCRPTRPRPGHPPFPARRR